MTFLAGVAVGLLMVGLWGWMCSHWSARDPLDFLDGEYEADISEWRRSDER